MASSGRKITLYTLWALAVFTVVGLYLTNRPAASDLKGHTGNPPDGTTVVVDQEPLTTARGLSNLPGTADEEQLSAEIVRVVDHEVDLAYASALRQAEQQSPIENQETQDINRQIRELQELVRADQEQVDRLKRLAVSGQSGSSDSSPCIRISLRMRNKT